MLSRQTTRSLLRRTTLPSSSLTSTTSSTTTSTYTRSKHTDSNNIINFEAKARVKEFQRRLGTSSKVEASAGSAAQVRLVERDGWGGDGFRGKGCGEADDRFYFFLFFLLLSLSLSLSILLYTGLLLPSEPTSTFIPPTPSRHSLDFRRSIRQQTHPEPFIPIPHPHVA